MPAHIDSPVPGISFDPADFRIRGWLWLEDEHSSVAAVEALDGETLLGETGASTFQIRADVNAKLGLPTGTRAGFEFSARHPTACANEPFALMVRARRHDGSHTAPLFTHLLAAPPPERHPLQMLRTCVPDNALGLEIGAHTQPVRGLSPYYTDAVINYTGSAGCVDFLADARTLPIPDQTLDYLCSSHVLEHLVDPIAALHEWHRVLRPGGWLYLVVPDKRYTFDAPRAVTSCDHHLRDFIEGTNAADAAVHVDDFVFNANWSMLSPHTAPARVPHEQADARARYLEELAHGRSIDIHFHTFTPDSLDALLHAAGFFGGEAPRFMMRSYSERYPPERADGIGLLLCKTDTSASPPRALETFTLKSATPGIAPLSLVCPISLKPLHLEETRPGERTLVSEPINTRYPVVHGRPVLLPPATGALPHRLWSDRNWRVANCLRAWNRHPSASESKRFGASSASV